MDIWEFYNLFGKNIAKIRKKHNMTQEQLAEILNMSRGFISQIESSGVKTGVSLDTLFLIAKIFNIDIKDFFDGFEIFIDKDQK